MCQIDAVFSKPIAHRGLHDFKNGLVENSQLAFEAAIAAGFGIECDIQLTGDDVPVVFHDYQLDRLTAQKGKVADISADQLIKVPLNGSDDTPMSLAQLLELVDGKVPLIVELKPQGKRNKKMAMAIRHVSQNYLGALAFKSFDPRMLYHLRRSDVSCPMGIVLEKETHGMVSWWEGMILRHLLHFPWSRFDFMSCRVTDLDLPMVRFFRKQGKKTMTWTVRTKSDMQLARAGADQMVFEDDAGQYLRQSPS